MLSVSIKRIKDYFPGFTFIEFTVILLAIFLLVIGFFAVQYFKSKVDYALESQLKVAGVQDGQNTLPAESLFSEDGGALTNDPIVSCGFKHVPDQKARRSECAKAVECEIVAGKWGLFLSRGVCLNAQAAASRQTVVQPDASPAPIPEPSPN